MFVVLLVLPENIGGYLYVDGLESSEYLLLPEGFDIGRLVTSDKVRWEIYDDFEKYFRKDDKRKLK